jgi:hypothetical protein
VGRDGEANQVEAYAAKTHVCGTSGNSVWLEAELVLWVAGDEKVWEG